MRRNCRSTLNGRLGSNSGRASPEEIAFGYAAQGPASQRGDHRDALRAREDGQSCALETLIRPGRKLPESALPLRDRERARPIMLLSAGF